RRARRTPAHAVAQLREVGQQRCGAERASHDPLLDIVGAAEKRGRRRGDRENPPVQHLRKYIRTATLSGLSTQESTSGTRTPRRTSSLQKLSRSGGVSVR